MKRILLGIALLLPSASFAQGYAGIDLFNWTYDEDGFTDFSGTGLRLRAGVSVNDYLSVEAHLASGGSDEKFVTIPNCCSGEVELELDHIISLMLRPQLPVNDRFNVYGLIGFSQGELTLSGGGGSISDDDSGLSFGAGAEFAVTDRVWLGADYVNYLSDSDYDATAFSVGGRVEF